MRNNYYDDDRNDRRSRRGSSDDRWNDRDDYRSGNGWNDNRSTYFGGRDRMDMDYDSDRNDDRYGYSNSRLGRSWSGSDSGRADYDDRRNDNYSYRSSSNGNRFDDDDYSRRGSDYGSRDSYDRNGRGWFGDYNGHSEAAERGWDNRRNERSTGSRERYREDERRTSRDDDRRTTRDDDRRTGSSDRGRGWFGESSRHSAASERGWDQRR